VTTRTHSAKANLAAEFDAIDLMRRRKRAGLATVAPVAAKAVVVAIANRADGTGRTTAGVARLCIEASVSARTFGRVVAVLADAGLLRVVRRSRLKGSIRDDRENAYQLDLDALEAAGFPFTRPARANAGQLNIGQSDARSEAEHRPEHRPIQQFPPLEGTKEPTQPAVLATSPTEKRAQPLEAVDAAGPTVASIAAAYPTSSRPLCPQDIAALQALFDEDGCFADSPTHDELLRLAWRARLRNRPTESVTWLAEWCKRREFREDLDRLRAERAMDRGRVHSTQRQLDGMAEDRERHEAAKTRTAALVAQLTPERFRELRESATSKLAAGAAEAMRRLADTSPLVRVMVARELDAVAPRSAEFSGAVAPAL